MSERVVRTRNFTYAVVNEFLDLDLCVDVASDAGYLRVLVCFNPSSGRGGIRLDLPTGIHALRVEVCVRGRFEYATGVKWLLTSHI